MYETKHWLRLAKQRGLLDPSAIQDFAALLNELLPKLNALLPALHRADGAGHVLESESAYHADPDFGNLDDTTYPSFFALTTRHAPPSTHP